MTNNFKKKSLNFYKQWQKEKNYCPALKEPVHISNKGWCHITGQSKSKKRVWKDVYRRLQLLPHAREIINTSTTIQNITVRYEKTYYALEAMRLVDTKNGKEWRKVRVVLEEDAKTKKIFLSVMDKKQKKP